MTLCSQIPVAFKRSCDALLGSAYFHHLSQSEHSRLRLSSSEFAICRTVLYRLGFSYDEYFRKCVTEVIK